MIQVKVDGIDKLVANLHEFSERRIKATVATAMTRTAVKARDAVQDHMRAVFDQPTPYTLRQLRYTPATATRPVATVGFNIAAIQDVQGNVIKYRDLGSGQTPAGKYLQFQVDGGQRALKRFEVALQRAGVLPYGWYAVPGERAKVDSFGNHSPAEIRQILSWFDAAQQVAGSTQNMGPAGRAKRRAGTKRKAGFEYFVVTAGAKRSWQRAGGGVGTHKMQPGIYRRTALAMGSRIEPVLIFIKGAAYRSRFDFYGVVQRVVDSTLPGELDRAIREAQARLAGAAGGAA